MANLFSWIGKLFCKSATGVGSAVAPVAQAIVSNVLTDEIHKVHDEIAAAITPLLAKLPAETQAELMPALVDVAKQAAVAYILAHVNSQASIPSANG